MHRDSITNILAVTVIVCLICSVVVSTAAVGLRPLQEANKKEDLQKSVLQVSGLYVPGVPVHELFKQVDAKIVELDTGSVVDMVNGMDAETFDVKAVADDAETSQPLDYKQDIAKISTRPDYTRVYLVRKDGVLDKVVLPIYGYGLWSTLYGFIALEEDGNTVYGIKYYDHRETPGLGGEVDNPKWRRLWQGKHVYGERGQPQLGVIKGKARSDSPRYAYEIDGLAGATLTSNGVSYMLRFWMGSMGYRPFLERVKAGELS